jgi:hypothetical protein
MATTPINLKRHLRLKDLRINRCKLHLLIDIITIAVCAVIGNANTWKEIVIFARRRKDWFQGVPGTIQRHPVAAYVRACL